MFIIGAIVALGLMTLGIFLAGTNLGESIGNCIIVLAAILFSFLVVIFVLSALIITTDPLHLLFYPFAF